jgi:hypothetical protein
MQISIVLQHQDYSKIYSCNTLSCSFQQIQKEVLITLVSLWDKKIEGFFILTINELGVVGER